MDPITAEFFSGRIQVDDRDGLLTQHLNTIEIRDLAGAPDESLVKVRRSGRGYGVILETTSRYLAVPFKVYLGGPVAGAVIQNCDDAEWLETSGKPPEVFGAATSQVFVRADGWALPRR